MAFLVWLRRWGWIGVLGGALEGVEMLGEHAPVWGFIVAVLIGVVVEPLVCWLIYEKWLHSVPWNER